MRALPLFSLLFSLLWVGNRVAKAEAEKTPQPLAFFKINIPRKVHKTKEVFAMLLDGWMDGYGRCMDGGCIAPPLGGCGQLTASGSDDHVQGT